MFLDDELYQIAKDADYTKWSVKSEVEKKMRECFINHLISFNEKTKLKGSDRNLLLQLKRYKIHWYNALKKLAKEGKKPCGEGSFEMIIQHHPLFKNIRDQILNYIK